MTAVALIAATFGGLAASSTPAAWAQEERDAIRSCNAVSGLAGPRIAGRPAVFDDRVGYDALLVRGRLKGRWAKGKPVTMLCLYERRTRLARTVEAPGWPTPLR